MRALLFLVWVQIVFESLPVSSSGHVALLSALLCRDQNYWALVSMLTSPVWMLWMYVPSLLVVSLFFVPVWWPLVTRLRISWQPILKLIVYTLCSNGVTALLYWYMHRYQVEIPLISGFIITAGILASLYCVPLQAPPGQLTIRKSLLLGVAQGVALLPGISRFATVFAVGRWIGIDARRSFYITWMLQWPLGFGMTLVSWYAYAQHPTPWMLPNPTFMLGVVGSASLFAFVGLYSMYYLATHNKLWLMSIYMIIPILISLAYHL